VIGCIIILIMKESTHKFENEGLMVLFDSLICRSLLNLFVNPRIQDLLFKFCPENL
jgi:hypothetical protein